MPKVKTRHTTMPDGWEIIEPTLTQLDAKMRDAEAESHEGKRKTESLWPIFRIHHQRSRYIYEMFYKKHAISKELYEFCLKEGYADGNLIAKWKKPGYDNLCCLRCIQTRDTNFGTTCICRVPKADLEPGRIVQCVHCGCRGCASGDHGADLLDLRSGTVHTHASNKETAREEEDTTHNSSKDDSNDTNGAAVGSSAPFPPGMPAFPFMFPMPSFVGDAGGAGMPPMPFPFPAMPFPIPGSVEGAQMPFPFPAMPFPMPGGVEGAQMPFPFPFPFPPMPTHLTAPSAEADVEATKETSDGSVEQVTAAAVEAANEEQPKS